MPTILEKVLPPYPDDLRLLTDSQYDMFEKTEEDRVFFNAQFKKMMHHRLRPVVERLIEEATDEGHWVDVHTLSNEKYLMYIHQCYTFSWKNAGRCDLSIVANYDYKEVFIIVEQYDGISCQQRFKPFSLDTCFLYKWLSTAFATR